MTDSNGDYVYFAEFSANTTRYAVQLDVYPVPVSADATTFGWSQPSTPGWTLPTAYANGQYPQITITSNGFRDIIGFDAQTFPATLANPTTNTTVTSMISDYTPQVTPVSTVVVTCSLVHNTSSIPDTLMYSFSPNVDYGSLISLQPSSPVFTDVQPGKVSEFSITFLDQSYDRLLIKDNNVVVMLTIKSAHE